MIDHKEERPDSGKLKKLVAFYVGTTVWTVFEDVCKAQGTSPFVMLRRLIRSHIIDETKENDGQV